MRYQTICGGLCLVALLATQANAVPITVFSEDFESYNVVGDLNPGIPLLSEGANEEWYGGRFENHDGGSIDQDVVVRNLPSVYPLHKKYARFEDEAGILFQIDTTNLTDVQLSFDWVTHLTSSNDDFVAGFYVGNIDMISDTSDGSPQPDLVHKFNDDGPTWGSSWTELLRDRNESSWTTESFSLPAGESQVWVAFWLDNGEDDLGKVDNIVVTGEPTPIPEPATLALLALGALCVVRRKS